jgi:hypothetical protein
MALGLFTMLIILLFLAGNALLVVGIIFIISGAKNKKRGGKGTKSIIGIVMVSVPIVLIACIGGKSLWNKAMIKCVSDEWRYKSIFTISSVEGSRNILKELLEAAADEDKDLFYREFSANARDDRNFEDTVEDFFDDMNDLDAELDPDVFLKGYGENVRLEGGKTTLDGRIYSAEIDGKTYYCYVRVCSSSPRNKDDIGLQQFIICTEDKVDELYEIIEEDDDIYLKVL